MITKQFSALTPGTVIGTNPADISKIQKGQTVELLVSAGYPDIVFSDGRHILLMNGGTGKVSGAIAKSSDAEDEPTWQPNGSLIAYRRGADQDHGAIWMVDMSKGATTAHRMTAGPDDRRPAFSPDGKVDRVHPPHHRHAGKTDGDLCFVRTSSTLRQGSCIKDPAFNVDRPAWSPDGRAILVVATDPKDANQTELGEYTSAKPFSSSPADWQWQGLITDKMHGKKAGEGVLYAAFSPDGTQVAIVANWAGTNLSLFRVFTAGWSNGQMGTPKGVTPSIRACEVAWRSDSGELAVTAADNCASGQGAHRAGEAVRPGNGDDAAPGRGAEPGLAVHPASVTCSAEAADARSLAMTTSATCAARRSRAAGGSSSWSATAGGSRCSPT